MEGRFVSETVCTGRSVWPGRRRRAASGAFRRIASGEGASFGGGRVGHGAVKSITNRMGFTLMEMMTALAIFGVIGLMATQILTGTIRLGETTRDRGEGLSDVQRAMDIIGRDIMQLTRRTVLDELGESTEPVLVAGTSLLELTRLGWQNPIGEPRSELQRVAYVHRDETLVRLFWPVLDRAPGSEPIAQVLLEGVSEASFGVRDDQGEQHGFWPLVTAEDETAPELAAVEMALRLKRYGHIERLWLVVPGPSYIEGTEAGGPDAGDTEGEPV